MTYVSSVCLSLFLLFPQVSSLQYIRNKRVVYLIDRGKSVFSAPPFCFFSCKKPGKHIIETLADSVSNVKLCVGEGSNIVCQVHVLCLFQLTMYKMFQTLCHSVIQKVSSLCDTKVVSLCDTKSFKQSIVSSLSFTQALHHSIHLVIQNFQTSSHLVIQIQYILTYPNSTVQANFIFCLDN